MQSQSPSEISFQDFFRFLVRGALPALAVGILVGASAYFVTQALPKVYRARATVLAAQTNAQLNQFGVSLATAPAIDIGAYRTAVLSSPVVRSALGEEFGLAEIQRVRNITTVRTEESRFSSLLYIDVEGEVPQRAAEVANALAQGLIDWDRQRATRALSRIEDTLASQIVAIDAQIEALQTAGASEAELNAQLALREQQRQQLLYARTLQTSAVGLLEIVEPALTPIRPVAPRPTLNAALFFVLAVLGTYALLLVRSSLDTRLRGTEDLAKFIGIPVIAEFPKLPGGQRRLPADAVRYLRTNLLFATTEDHPKIILVSSGNEAEGKSSVALSLAESFARNDHRTLLIDADLRKPVIGETYGIRLGAPELVDYLRDPQTPFEPVRIAIEGNEPLDLIPTYRAVDHPTELLGRSIRTFLAMVREEYDVIVIDSAPLLPVADTLTIAPHVTGTLLVASIQKADRRVIVATVEMLERIGVRILGVVATQISQEVLNRGGHRGYGYGYGANAD